MTQTDTRVALDLALRGGPQCSDAELAEAAAYVEALCASLGLPARATLATEPGEGAAQVRIGDRRASLEPAGGDGAGGIVERLGLTVVRHRELLVTDAVAAAIGDGWELAEDWSAQLADLLRECVQLGRSVQRLRTRLAGAHPGERDALLEATLADAPPPLVTLALARADHERAYEAGADGARTARALDDDGGTLDELLALLADGLFYELGTLVGVAVSADDALAAGFMRLDFNDVRGPVQRGLTTGTLLCNAGSDELDALKVDGQDTFNPGTGAYAAIVDARQRTAVEQQPGVQLWGHHGYCVLAASGVLRRDAGAFVTSEIVEFLLHRLRESFPALVAQAEARWGALRVTRVLRRLLEEQIGIRDLRAILEALLRVDGVTSANTGERIVFAPNTGLRFPVRDGRDVDSLRSAELAECARMAIPRYISHKYTRGQNTLIVYLLDPAIEQRLLRADVEPLGGAERDDILAAVRREVGELPFSPTNPVLLTAVEIRHRARVLVKHEVPHLEVLSYNELVPDMNIQPIARISVE